MRGCLLADNGKTDELRRLSFWWCEKTALGDGAYVKVGDASERGEKRQSVVFVRKGLNHIHG